MIFTERTITVVNDSATINKPLILYRGDKNIELKITIAESQFKFRNTDASNVIETTDASYAQLVINTPYNSPIFSEVAATKNGTVIFVITEAMIDEIREVGAYEIQIRLLDDNKQSRASIPPVSNAIEIREPIAIEDGSAVDSNVVNVAKVNRALTTTSAPLEVFDSQGNYIKKTWGDGDLITDAALNKMEAGIDGVNKKVANNSSQINDIENYSLVKHTDGKVYIKKQDGTLIGTGVEVGGNTDLSKITMSVEGQTLKLLNDGTQIATVEIPTATVTDEQLTAIIQSKIDDGTLSSMTIQDNSVTPEKTTFLKEKQGLLNVTFSDYGYLKVISDYIDITNLDVLYFATKPQNTKYANYGIITYDSTQGIVNSETSLDSQIKKMFNSNLEQVLYGQINCNELKSNNNNIKFIRLTQHSDIIEGSTRLVADLPINIDTFSISEMTSVSEPIINDIKNNINIQIENTNFVTYEGSLVDFSRYENSGFSGTLFDQVGSNQNVFCDYIDTSVNKDIYLRLFMETSTTVSQHVQALTYDSNKNFIAKLSSSDWTFVRGDNCTTTNPDYSTTPTGNINGTPYGRRSVQKITVGENVQYVRISISGTYSGLLSNLNKASQYTIASYNDIFDFDSIPEKYGMKINNDFKNVVNKCVEKESKVYSMVMIGDSLTNWAGGSNTESGFLKVVYDKTGVISTNRGLAGAWWQTADGQDQCGVNRVNYIVENKEKYDVYAFMLGTNAGSTTDTGETSSNTTTMCGAIRYCMETLKAYDPTGIILVCLPPQRAEGNDNQKLVNDTIKTIVEDEYSIRTLDIYRHSGIVPNTTISGINYLGDGLHLADNGITVLGNLLASEIKYLLCL